MTFQHSHVFIFNIPTQSLLLINMDPFKEEYVKLLKNNIISANLLIVPVMIVVCRPSLNTTCVIGRPMTEGT